LLAAACLLAGCNDVVEVPADRIALSTTPPPITATVNRVTAPEGVNVRFNATGSTPGVLAWTWIFSDAAPDGATRLYERTFDDRPWSQILPPAPRWMTSTSPSPTWRRRSS
jgi:hypothetical protein